MSFKNQFKITKNLSILLRATAFIPFLAMLNAFITSGFPVFDKETLLYYSFLILFSASNLIYIFSIITSKKQLALFSLAGIGLFSLFILVLYSYHAAPVLFNFSLYFKKWFFFITVYSLGYVGLLIQKKRNI